MFWSILLPLKITFWCLVALVLIATVFAPKLQWKRGKTFFVSGLLASALFLFLPAVKGVMVIVDLQRFGLFEYDTFADINDWRVERYLPPAASELTLEKDRHGFRARFSISEADLMTFLDGFWIRHGNDWSENSRSEPETMTTYGLESQGRAFGHLGWPPLEDAMLHHSPTKSNGAGFSVWFSPSKDLAYSRAGYW